MLARRVYVVLRGEEEPLRFKCSMGYSIMKNSSWTFGLAATVLLVGTPLTADAQGRLILGRVSDSVTAGPVQIGQVYLVGTETRTPLNADGTFVVHAPHQDVKLAVFAAGYEPREIEVPRKQRAVILALPPGDYVCGDSLPTDVAARDLSALFEDRRR